MNSTEKQVYEAPSAEVVLVHMEHFVCESGVRAGRYSYGTAQEDTWD